MTVGVNALVAAEHVADLQRAAEHYHSGKSDLPSGAKVVALRLAEANDSRVLSLLAELDEEPELSGGTLVALIDGEVVAAMSLDDGRVVSNPFVVTSDAVSLLTLRAEQLVGLAVRQARRRWRPRFA